MFSNLSFPYFPRLPSPSVPSSPRWSYHCKPAIYHHHCWSLKSPDDDIYGAVVLIDLNAHLVAHSGEVVRLRKVTQAMIVHGILNIYI